MGLAYEFHCSHSISWLMMYLFILQTLLKQVFTDWFVRLLNGREGALNRVHADMRLEQRRTASVDRISVQPRNSSTELQSTLSQTARRRS